MSRRADLVEQTRQEITAATARLHTTIGPASTSVAAIAREAGVTRVTVYRHFPDMDALFEACRAHWQAENPPPDVLAWLEEPALEPRLRRALRELYAWFRAHADELYPIYRDMTSIPRSSQAAMREDRRHLAEILVGDRVDGAERSRIVRAVARHLVDFRTWWSLAIDDELTDEEAAELGVRVLVGMTGHEP